MEAKEFLKQKNMEKNTEKNMEKKIIELMFRILDISFCYTLIWFILNE